MPPVKVPTQEEYYNQLDGQSRKELPRRQHMHWYPLVQVVNMALSRISAAVHQGNVA